MLAHVMERQSLKGAQDIARYAFVPRAARSCAVAENSSLLFGVGVSYLGVRSPACDAGAASRANVRALNGRAGHACHAEPAASLACLPPSQNSLENRVAVRFIP